MDMYRLVEQIHAAQLSATLCVHRPLHPTCTHVLMTLECSERRVGARYVNWMLKHVVSTHLYCAYCDMFLDLLPLSVSCSVCMHVAFQEQETGNAVDNQLIFA